MTNIIIKIVSIIIAFLFITNVAAAYEQLYQDGRNCELVAKQAKEAFGMKMVLIVPLDENGAEIRNGYSGHWINSYEEIGGTRYIEMGGYYGNTVFASKEGVDQWYYYLTGHHAVLYTQGDIPFPVIYHYV